MSQGKTYFREIDSLRALSVLSVIVFHLDRTLLPGGYTGVDCFFVISGFVVTHSLLRVEPRSLVDLLTQFYARRLLRIAPALMVVLLTTALLSVLFIPEAWLSKRNEEIGIAAFFGVSNVLLARPSNAYFGPVAEFNPFTHTWSLGVEEQFYLVAPLILYLTLRRPGSSTGQRMARSLIAVMSVGSLALCAWWTVARPTFAFYLLPPRFWELGVGVLLAMSQTRWLPLLAKPRDARIVVGIGLVALAVSVIGADVTAFPFPWALPGVVAAALLIAGIVAQPHGVLPWPLKTAPVQYVGRVSYSLYLWHWPVFVLFLWTVGLQSWATRLTALALAVLLAVLSYHLVEIPVRSASWFRVRRPSRAVTAGIVSIALSGLAGAIVLRSTSALSLSLMSREQHNASIPALPGAAQCRNRFDTRALADGELITFSPADCKRPRAGARLFVVGDSHAAAYMPMFDRYAADTAHEVQVLRRDGCQFVALTGAGDTSAECRNFARAAIDHLTAEARPGDIVFLTSLRLPRFADQWGSPDAERPVTASIRDAARQQSLVLGAIAQLAPVKDIDIVVEAPKPLFRSPPFRCADWFNAGNPACAGGFHLSRTELDTLREPVLETMDALSKQMPTLRVWDPAVTLCNTAGCDAFSNGHPLFFDGDHLSTLGNATLYPAFAAFMAGLWK